MWIIRLVTLSLLFSLIPAFAGNPEDIVQAQGRGMRARVRMRSGRIGEEIVYETITTTRRDAEARGLTITGTVRSVPPPPVPSPFGYGGYGGYSGTGQIFGSNQAAVRFFKRLKNPAEADVEAEERREAAAETGPPPEPHPDFVPRFGAGFDKEGSATDEVPLPKPIPPPSEAAPHTLPRVESYEVGNRQYRLKLPCNARTLLMAGGGTLALITAGGILYYAVLPSGQTDAVGPPSEVPLAPPAVIAEEPKPSVLPKPAKIDPSYAYVQSKITMDIANIGEKIGAPNLQEKDPAWVMNALNVVLYGKLEEKFSTEVRPASQILLQRDGGGSTLDKAYLLFEWMKKYCEDRKECPALELKLATLNDRGLAVLRTHLPGRDEMMDDNSLPRSIAWVTLDDKSYCPSFKTDGLASHFESDFIEIGSVQTIARVPKK